MESLYNYVNSYGEVLQNEPYNYKENLMKKTLSNYMFRNTTLADFIGYINDIMYTMIESIKKIRLHDNFAVSKEYRKLN